MALTKQVTRLWPTKDSRNIFHPGINLKLLEDEEEVRSVNFTRDFTPGGNIDNIKADIIAEAQAYIDRYKEERSVYTASAYSSAVSDIDTALEV